MTQRIAVLGAGANGASLGADLARAGHDVTLIDQWPENVEVMRRHGLRIELPDEILEVPVRAYHLCDVCTFSDPFDIVLVVVKAYDTRWACHLIEPCLKPDGLMVGVQNGMTTGIVADVAGLRRTMGCVIEVSSAMLRPGVVTRYSSPERSWFAVGSIDPAVRGREAEVSALLSHSGQVEVVADIEATKWMKLVSNATTLAAASLVGLPLHEAVALPGMRDLMVQSGQEAFDTGRALRHAPLPIFGLSAQDVEHSNDVVAAMLDKVLTAFTNPASIMTIQQDWIKGRRSETGDINGLVASEASRLGRRAPVNGAIADLAHRIEAGQLAPDRANLPLVRQLVGS